MAYQDKNIPPKPSPRAPPPPRSFTPPPPQYSKPKPKPKPKKKKSREQLKKSQIIVTVVLIFFVILLIFIAYLSTILISKEASGEIDRHSDAYPFKFEIQEILSQKIPTRIEVSASNDVEVYIINENKYNESMDINEIRIMAINKNSQETTKFVFEEYLSPGDYVIISYCKDNNEDVSLDYKITRFYLMPFLWLISLIFMIPIIICVTLIIILQSKKTSALPEKYQDVDYTRDARHYPEEYDYSDSRSSFDSYSHRDEDYRHHPSEDRHAESREDYYGSHSRHDSPQHIARSPTPTSQDRYNTNYRDEMDRAEMAPPPSKDTFHEYRRNSRVYDDGSKETSTTKPTTVPCKCGEVIVISDPTRPLRIKCPRCGRRGILEGTEKSPEEDIFY